MFLVILNKYVSFNSLAFIYQIAQQTFEMPYTHQKNVFLFLFIYKQRNIRSYQDIYRIFSIIYEAGWNMYTDVKNLHSIFMRSFIIYPFSTCDDNISYISTMNRFLLHNPINDNNFYSHRKKHYVIQNSPVATMKQIFEFTLDYLFLYSRNLELNPN